MSTQGMRYVRIGPDHFRVHLGHVGRPAVVDILVRGSWQRLKSNDPKVGKVARALAAARKKPASARNAMLPVKSVRGRWARFRIRVKRLFRKEKGE